MIVYVCCGGTESHCAKWPVTEVFHVNPMIHTEPPRHRGEHTHTHTPRSNWRHTQAYESACTHLRASWEIVRFARRHLRKCIQYGFRPGCSRKVLRRVYRNYYYFVFYHWCFVLLVQKVKADSKQTNSERGGEAYRTNKPLSEKWETRDLVNSHWHNKPGKIHIRTIFVHLFTSNRLVLPSCALLSFAPLIH